MSIESKRKLVDAAKVVAPKEEPVAPNLTPASDGSVPQAEEFVAPPSIDFWFDFQGNLHSSENEELIPPTQFESKLVRKVGVDFKASGNPKVDADAVTRILRGLRDESRFQRQSPALPLHEIHDLILVRLANTTDQKFPVATVAEGVVVSAEVSSHTLDRSIVEYLESVLPARDVHPEIHRLIEKYSFKKVAAKMVGGFLNAVLGR